MVLGTPVGHDEYVRSLLEKIQAKQQFLLNAIPTVPDVQSAWLLLLHCASARANYQLRVVRPELVNSFAESHDQGFWRCLCAIVGVPSDTCDVLTRATATLPLSLGGLGLRSAARTREAACWASWADSLSMVQARHPSVAEPWCTISKGNHGRQVCELPVRQRQSWMGSKVSSCLSGPIWRLDYGQRTERQKIMSPVPPAKVGSTKRPAEWNSTSGRQGCSRT